MGHGEDGSERGRSMDRDEKRQDRGAHCTTRFMAFVARSHFVLLLAKLPTHNTRRRFLTFVMWLMRLCGLSLALLDLLLQGLSVWRRIVRGSCATYQGSHGAVKSMSVVASELGVGTLERRVSVGLGLLDTVCRRVSWSFSSV